MSQTLKISGMELLRMRLPLRIRSKKNSKARGKYHNKPFLSREIRQLQDSITLYARQSWIGSAPYEGTVAVEIVVHWRTRVHADTPNTPEIICDALQGVVYKNDRQIGALLVESCECGEDAVTIRVRTTDRQAGACVDA